MLAENSSANNIEKIPITEQVMEGEWERIFIFRGRGTAEVLNTMYMVVWEQSFATPEMSRYERFMRNDR